MSPSVSVRLLLTQSDARLVELARAGHERAFEALVERYRRALLGYCRRQLLPHERAEDALQQGLLQAWLALREGTEVRHVKPWLYSIAHNAALNMRRSGYSYVQLSETLSSANAPEDDLDRRIAVREALAGLAALPEMQREALLRTAVDGVSYQEAADILGLSEGAVRGLVHRARTTLRTALTALTPPPLLSWMLGPASVDTPLTNRIAEVGACGGSTGLAAGLLKLAATAATAGVVVGGIGISHHRRSDATAHRQRAVAVVSLDHSALAVQPATRYGLDPVRTRADAALQIGHPPTRHSQRRDPARGFSTRPVHRGVRRTASADRPASTRLTWPRPTGARAVPQPTPAQPSPPAAPASAPAAHRAPADVGATAKRRGDESDAHEGVAANRATAAEGNRGKGAGAESVGTQATGQRMPDGSPHGAWAGSDEQGATSQPSSQARADDSALGEAQPNAGNDDHPASQDPEDARAHHAKERTGAPIAGGQSSGAAQPANGEGS